MAIVLWLDDIDDGSGGGGGGGDDDDDVDDDGIDRWQLSLAACRYATSPQAGPRLCTGRYVLSSLVLV